MGDIFRAVASGDVDTALSLLRQDRSTAQARNDDGVSVIVWALYVEQPALATLIAQAKVQLDVFEAAALGTSDRLDMLLDDDIRVAHHFSSDGYTALHFAAFFGRPECARRLLSAGADVNAIARNSTAETPLHAAVAGRHPEVVRVLLDAMAVVDAREQGGYTPLHAAAQAGDRRATQLLLAAGANPRARTDAGHTPLELADESVHDLVTQADARLRR